MRTPRWVVFWLWLVSGLGGVLASTGCASLPAPDGRRLSLDSTPRGTSVSSERPRPDERGRPHRRGGGAGGDTAWERLLTDAGLDARDARPLRSDALTPTQAARLLGVVLRKPVTLGTFPPRMALGHLLRQVLEDGEMSREELSRRVARFARVAVLRPDGYLAWVHGGRTQQKAADVQWRDGAFRAGPFELGRFYVSDGFVFRLADEQLEPVDGPVFVEVYDDADYLGRTLDGAEAAFVKLALALGQFFTRPLDSLAALRHLPAGVTALIASSPEYFERFRHMTRGEQVRALSELATNLLVATGTATSTTRTVTGALAGAEATVPVLSLSAQGALTLERVAVPVGRTAAVLGGGPGAVLVLHRANSAAGGSSPAGGRGPGQWGPSGEKGAPPRARAYQEQITGHFYDEAYWVGGVDRKSGGTKFDGFKDGVLLEAKGPGYAEFFDGKLAPKEWFRNSGKAAELVAQARRQSELVMGMGIPIEWHVAEKHAADAIRRMLENASVTGIEVIHSPAL
ncbi:Tox-REase-5 domain-containing protein [Pyxidicoccus fallax]|nr:Tox-REase-5 domain-containing protein [Pyxidicoccus fallax]